MQRSLLMETDRQVAVAVHLTCISQEVPRTIHRFGTHRFVFRLDEKHILPVVLPMSGSFPKRFVIDERGFYLYITGRKEELAHIVRQRVIQHRAFGKPKRRSGRPWMKHEQAE